MAVTFEDLSLQATLSQLISLELQRRATYLTATISTLETRHFQI